MARKIGKISVFVLVLSLLCGCGSINESEKKDIYTIGVELKKMDSAYWMDMKEGMTQAASDYGVNLNLLYPVGSQENREQKTQVNDLLDSDIDVLIYAPGDCYSTRWIASATEKKNILFMTVDDRAMDWHVPYIGMDNKDMGKKAGQYISQTLPQGGSILVLLGPFTQVGCKDRLIGLQEWLAESNAPFRIRNVGYGELTEEAGYAAVMNEKNPSDAIFCQNIALAQGVIAALEEKGWNSVIVTVDTEEDAGQVLKRDKVSAILSIDGYKIGYQSIENSVKALQSGQMTEDVQFESKFVVKDR